jgi:hypothetical protein
MLHPVCERFDGPKDASASWDTIPLDESEPLARRTRVGADHGGDSSATGWSFRLHRDDEHIWSELSVLVFLKFVTNSQSYPVLQTPPPPIDFAKRSTGSHEEPADIRTNIVPHHGSRLAAADLSLFRRTMHQEQQLAS